MNRNRVLVLAIVASLYNRYLTTKDAINRILSREEEGQTIVEYVLLIVLIALVVFASQPGLTGALRNAFNRIGASVSGS
jgi:Flp pilus assembly pilin Flp